MVHIRTLLDKMNEIDEGRMKDIFTANQEGKSAKEIAKALKLPLSTVKSILGEGKEEIKEFTDSQLDVLARQYAGLKGRTISIDQANKLRQIFNRIPDRSLDSLRRKKIPFLSGLALSRMVQKGMPVKEDKDEPELKPGKGAKIGPAGKIALAKEKDTDALEAQLTTAKGQIELLKTKLENEKNKAVKPEPNKETGEVPLTVGVAHKYLKDKAEKEKEEKKDVKENDDINWAGKLEEKFAVQVTKKDGGKFIHGSYKSKEEAEKFVKWYKTGDLRTTKKIEVVKEEDEPQSNDQVKSLKVKLDKEKDTDALEKQLTAAQGQINILKQKLENEKNKVVKPEPNRETGEVPLTIGVAHKYLKDKQEKEMKKEEVDNYPTSDINKKKHAAYKDPKSGERKPVYTHEGAKLVYETIKGLKNKAEKSGMPYSILKKVYDRGMAAWRGGHRPGTSQQQWAFARVNSFVTKSSGTWGGADKDLAKQVRGSKK